MRSICRGQRDRDLARHEAGARREDLERAQNELGLVHGGDDDIVPLNQSTLLESRLRESKIPVELVVVKNGNHILAPVRDTASPGLKVVSRKVVAYFDRTLKQ